MRQRTMLVGAWLLVTAVVTLLAWAAVREVAGQVSPQAALPLPADIATPAVVPPDPATESAAGRTDGDEPTSPRPGSPVTEAYDLVGGVVTVRYRSGDTTLVEATPNSGFGVDVRDGGPEKVDVRFRSDDHESRLVTEWEAGAPRPAREERSR